MKKQLLSLLSICLMLMSCGQQNKQETTMDFVDNVKVALADGQPPVDAGACRM